MSSIETFKQSEKAFPFAKTPEYLEPKKTLFKTVN